MPPRTDTASPKTTGTSLPHPPPEHRPAVVYGSVPLFSSWLLRPEYPPRAYRVEGGGANLTEEGRMELGPRWAQIWVCGT